MAVRMNQTNLLGDIEYEIKYCLLLIFFLLDFPFLLF